MRQRKLIAVVVCDEERKLEDVKTRRNGPVTQKRDLARGDADGETANGAAELRLDLDILEKRDDGDDDSVSNLTIDCGEAVSFEHVIQRLLDFFSREHRQARWFYIGGLSIVETELDAVQEFLQNPAILLAMSNEVSELSNRCPRWAVPPEEYEQSQNILLAEGSGGDGRECLFDQPVFFRIHPAQSNRTEFREKPSTPAYEIRT